MRQSSCTLCERIPTKPNASTTWLVNESHEAVGIALCGCEKLWLHFWVEIFDDITDYWAPLSSEDAEAIRKSAEQNGADDVLGLARSIIERERTVLMDRTARIEWIAGEHAMLSGPPW